MEVILIQDIKQLGKAGQKLSVKDGYARNFLIPRGLAAPATQGAGAVVNTLRNAQRRSAEMAKEKAEELARRLTETVCRFPVPVGEQGKLHGAVTAADIAEELRKQGIPLEKHQVQLERPLTHLGEVAVPVRLHPEVKAAARVVLVEA